MHAGYTWCVRSDGAVSSTTLGVGAMQMSGGVGRCVAMVADGSGVIGSGVGAMVVSSCASGTDWVSECRRECVQWLLAHQCLLQWACLVTVLDDFQKFLGVRVQ